MIEPGAVEDRVLNGGIPLERVPLDRPADPDGPSPGVENSGDDRAITAVVAGTAEDQHALRLRPGPASEEVGGPLAGVLHQDDRRQGQLVDGPDVDLSDLVSCQGAEGDRHEFASRMGSSRERAPLLPVAPR